MKLSIKVTHVRTLYYIVINTIMQIKSKMTDKSLLGRQIIVKRYINIKLHGVG